MIELSPIAYVRNSRSEMIDDFWGNVVSEIVLTEDMPEESLQGIEQFSHLEIIFYFHKINPGAILTGAAHPRENPRWPVTGIFAQRKKNRPNLLGTTIVKLLERKGKILKVSNFDALDGTPVLDIKPVAREFLPQEPVSQPNWMSELMRDYWKEK